MPTISVIVPGQDPTSFDFDLDQQLIRFGRDEKGECSIDHASLSHQHAELMRIDGGYILRDLHSLNGTLLDRKRMMVVDFNEDNHYAMLGDVTVRINYTEEELQLLSEEEFVSMQTAEEVQKETVPAEEKSPPPPSQAKLPPPSPPKAAPSPAYAPTVNKPKQHKEKSGGGFFSFLFRCALAVLAIFAGLAVRHHQETGGENLVLIVKNALEQKFSN